MTSGYQPVNNRSESEIRLLSISESTSENNENSIKLRGPQNNKKQVVEDLKLDVPKNCKSTTSSKMNKIRRKIRLKRKQRDSTLKNGVALNINNSSTSETGGSELEADEYCSPMDICLTCMPSNAINCFCSRQSCCRSRSRAHRQLWLNAFILFIFAVALAGLAYYTMTLQNQLAILTIHLDPVLDEKSELKKIQEELQTKLNSVATNQSILQDNLASIYTKVENLSSQVSVLNGSISTALVNLANAPQLKEVPEKIVKLSQELGQFGSRLTGVESQVTGTKNDLSKVQDSLKKTANNPDVATSNAHVDKPALDALTLQFDSKLHNQTARLDEKIDKAAENFNILGTNLTEQLQKQEIHAAKSWKLLDELNTNVQNVSAKAASNELISRENQAELAKLQKTEKLQKSSNNNGGSPSTPKVINNNLN